jgi:hypothetical protein
MKTRSSSGVGMKVDLEFDLNSLRITDPGEDAQEENRQGQGSSNIMGQIKSQATVTPPQEASKVNAQVDSSKLKNMLAGLKKAE